jgi:hypothetical protein
MYGWGTSVLTVVTDRGVNVEDNRT